jgi:hypothetical protein
MVPPSTRPSEFRPAGDRLAPWVRGVLAGIVVGLLVVFGIAVKLNPYRDDGSALVMATHQQLGLPPCTFWEVTGYPCPACGMSTSFALLIRGDVANSVRANWVGTLLAAFCLALVPWGVYAIVRGRSLFVRSLEKALIGVVIAVLGLAMLRWAVVVALIRLGGPGA